MKQILEELLKSLNNTVHDFPYLDWEICTVNTLLQLADFVELELRSVDRILREQKGELPVELEAALKRILRANGFTVDY